MNVSVCMATYNGARYLPAQLASILAQLGADDEVVVVDDASTDDTLAVLRAVGDARIGVHLNSRNLGYVQTFGRALSLARHEVVFLCDQDDVWLPGRVQRMLGAMADSGACVVASNSAYVDSDGSAILHPCHRLKAADSTHHLANIAGIFAGRRGYFGCAMAARRAVLAVALPMPPYVESHDLWLAKVGNAAGSMVHLEDNTLARRIHATNVTDPNRPLWRKLWSRIVFLRSIVLIALRLARRGWAVPESAHPLRR